MLATYSSQLLTPRQFQQGGIESGENPEETLWREPREETSLEKLISKLSTPTDSGHCIPTHLKY